MYIANIIFALFFISNYKNKQGKGRDKWILIILPIVFSISAMYFTFLFMTNSSYKLLRPIHFIEYSDDSAWYLINNNFQKTDGSQEINGISQYDLDKIKANFIDIFAIQKKYTIAMGKFCRNELPLDKTDCSQAMSTYVSIHNSLLPPPQPRFNALHGYMAWNLGNIKVFCPRQVEFTDNSEKNKQPAKQCLLIDGKYLQILDDQYITSDLKP